MRNTIKADSTEGYKVFTIDRTKHFDLWEMASSHFEEVDMNEYPVKMVVDGEYIVMFALARSVEDYEAEKEGNECFHFCEVFTSRKGSQYIYWRDEETNTDYITKIN